MHHTHARCVSKVCPENRLKQKLFRFPFFPFESANCGSLEVPFLPHPQAADAQETEKRQPTVSWAGTYYI